MNEQCTWIFYKGPHKGKRCTANIKNMETQRCAKHSRNNQNQTESEKESIMSDAIPQEEDKINEKNISRSSKMSSNHSICNDNDDDNNEDIVLTKYFVYDCIRQFLREEKEMNEILFSTKKPENKGSNLTNILAMSAVGCLPILLKQINLSSILNNATHQQGNIIEACANTGVSNRTEEGQNTTSQQ